MADKTSIKCKCKAGCWLIAYCNNLLSISTTRLLHFKIASPAAEILLCHMTGLQWEHGWHSQAHVLLQNWPGSCEEAADSSEGEANQKVLGRQEWQNWQSQAHQTTDHGRFEWGWKCLRKQAAEHFLRPDASCGHGKVSSHLLHLKNVWIWIIFRGEDCFNGDNDREPQGNGSKQLSLISQHSTRSVEKWE